MTLRERLHLSALRLSDDHDLAQSDEEAVLDDASDVFQRGAKLLPGTVLS